MKKTVYTKAGASGPCRSGRSTSEEHQMMPLFALSVLAFAVRDLWSYPPIQILKQVIKIWLAHEAIGIVEGNPGEAITAVQIRRLCHRPFTHGCRECDAPVVLAKMGLVTAISAQLVWWGSSRVHALWGMLTGPLCQIPGQPSDYTEAMLQVTFDTCWCHADRLPCSACS